MTPFLKAQDVKRPEPERADVVVYGIAPGGVMAAIAATREGASTILLEQTQRVGRLSTSGLKQASRVFGDDLWEVSSGLAEIGKLNLP